MSGRHEFGSVCLCVCACERTSQQAWQRKKKGAPPKRENEAVLRRATDVIRPTSTSLVPNQWLCVHGTAPFFSLLFDVFLPRTWPSGVVLQLGLGFATRCRVTDEITVSVLRKQEGSERRGSPWAASSQAASMDCQLYPVVLGGDAVGRRSFAFALPHAPKVVRHWPSMGADDTTLRRPRARSRHPFMAIGQHSRHVMFRSRTRLSARSPSCVIRNST